MITIQLAGEKIQIEDAITLVTLLAQQGYANNSCAVVINRKFIPVAHYAVTTLQANDIVDIITPMQGG